MQINKALLVLFLGLSLPALAAGFSLPYGAGEGQVGFINATVQPDVEELYPTGPRAFRVSGGDFWVLDSVGKRILHLTAAGKPVGTVKLPAQDKGVAEDLAIVEDKGKVSAIFVLSGASQEILKLSPMGEIVARFGGLGEEPGKFLQVYRLEVGASGKIYVADHAKQTLTVLGPDGAFIRDMHWEWSGFALDADENLCRLQWDEAAGVNHLIVETAEGKAVRKVALQVGPHTNPDLWFVDANGDAWLSFIPPDGFKGTFRFARCGADGKQIQVADLKPPVVMNRFLARDAKGGFFLVDADYNQAPKATFNIGAYEPK